MISNAFRYNAGLIRANGTPFFTGDGSANSATLLDRQGNPISSAKLKRVDAIHRADWQGRQLLYPTARTNILLHSTDLSDAVWQVNGVTKSDAITLVPGGMAKRITTTGTASLCMYQSLNGGTSGGVQCVSALIEIGSSDNATAPRIAIYNGTTGTIGALNLTVASGITSLLGVAVDGGARKVANTGPNGGPVYWLWVAGNIGAAGQQIRHFIYPSPGVSGASLIAHGAQIENGSVPTSLIVTTTAARTVTDYTLSGSTVNFGEVPASGAICDWTGVARR